MNRRQFIGSLIASTAMATQSPIIWANPTNIRKQRQLNLYNIHTGERFRGAYLVDGHFSSHALHALCHITRDHRQDEMWSMDLALFERLHQMHQEFGLQRTIYLISGYRSPNTNSKLRQQNHSVAEHSMHIEGRALDVRIPGVRHDTLFQWAKEFHQGGLGYYQDSGYIHIDSGRPRTWLA